MAKKCESVSKYKKTHKMRVTNSNTEAKLRFANTVDKTTQKALQRDTKNVEKKTQISKTATDRNLRPQG